MSVPLLTLGVLGGLGGAVATGAGYAMTGLGGLLQSEPAGALAGLAGDAAHGLFGDDQPTADAPIDVQAQLAGESSTGLSGPTSSLPLSMAAAYEHYGR